MATQNSDKLTWGEICQRYDQQWVELVDFDWPETEPYPHAGIVRVHAASRRDFDELILQDPPEYSALLFVGERKVPPGIIWSMNLHQWKPALNEGVAVPSVISTKAGSVFSAQKHCATLALKLSQEGGGAMTTENSEKLTWEEICQRYDQQWVQLVDFDWPEEEPDPRSGVVRVHAAKRRDFDQLILQDPPDYAALLFVGERKVPPGIIWSMNLHQWKSASK